MTVSATASNAATQAYRTAHPNNTASASGAAFSAVANAADQLQGIAATGGSTLSSNMLSSLLGMNSASAASTPLAPPPPDSAGSSTSHHHGLGAYMEGLASTAATLVTAAAV